MFRALAIIASFIGAAAFSPVRAPRSSALKMSFENAIGAQVPNKIYLQSAFEVKFTLQKL